MEGKKSALISSLLLMLLVLSSWEAPLVEAMVCKSPSTGFKGICVSDTNCAAVCMGEEYGGGQCEGFQRKCVCQKKC